MSRNDWHEAKMGTCVCGKWAKVLDDMCAECHDTKRQDQREAAYLKRNRELKAVLRAMERMATTCDQGQYIDYPSARIIFEEARELLEQSDE